MQRLCSQLENISQTATPAHKEMLRSAVVAGGTVSAKQSGLFGASDCYCVEDFTERNILAGLPSAARRQQLNT